MPANKQVCLGCVILFLIISEQLCLLTQGGTGENAEGNSNTVWAPSLGWGAIWRGKESLYPVSHHCDATKTQPVFTVRISFMKCSIITQRTMGENDALFWQSSFLTMCFGPWVGKIPGEGNSYLLQYSGLENSMDCVVHRVPECWTRLTFTSVSEILLCVQYSYCLI